MQTRRYAMGALFGLPCIFQQSPAAGQSYPSRHIRLLVGYSPGGGSDIAARILAPLLEDNLAGKVIVENVVGGAGTIAANQVAKATPDGHTLLLGNNASNAISAAVNPSLPFDPRKDLTPLALIAEVPEVIAVSGSSPLQTVQAVRSFAKANPGKLSYASPGFGSAPHLAGKLFEKLAGVELLHVPFRGGSQGMTEIVAGRVDLSFDSVATILPFVENKLVRPLAVGAQDRIPQLPNVPTAAEAGLDGFVIGVWFALFAPAGVPAGIAQRISEAVERSFESREFRERLSSAMGAQPRRSLTSGELSLFVDSEIKRYVTLAKDADLKRDN